MKVLALLALAVPAAAHPHPALDMNASFFVFGAIVGVVCGMLAVRAGVNALTAYIIGRKLW
jgi:hypothetical protein